MSASPSARPLAVVTGASAGIGFHLARVLGERGYDLIVNSSKPRIEQAAVELTATGADVRAVQADLTTPDGVRTLHAAVTADGRPLEAIALNAGHGAGGAFVGGTDLDDELHLIALNVTSVVHLTKLVAADMVAAGHGRILITSSVAATQPGSFQLVYNASKAFVQSFAEGLRDELKDTGVTVTALQPGPTETEFFSRAGMEDTKAGDPKIQDDPAKVAEQGVDALLDGKDSVVAGSLSNKLQTAAARVLPDTVKARLHRQMAKPRSGE